MLTRLEEIKKMKIPSIKRATGRQVFSTPLPNTFYFTDEDFSVKKGEIKGIITKGPIHKMIASLHSIYGKECTLHFINRIQFLANAFLLIRGFSVGYKDCML